MALAVAAACVLGPSPTPSSAALTCNSGVAACLAWDGFDRANGTVGTAASGQTWLRYKQSCGTCTPNFLIESQRLRVDQHTSMPTIAHAVVDTGVAAGIDVHADISMSPTFQRSNVGLLALYADRLNHLFCKIEVTHGNPGGLIAIGEVQRGALTSLLSFKKNIGLRNGQTYHLSMRVPASPSAAPVTCTVSGTGIGATSVSYKLNAADISAYGGGKRQGLRVKVASDEDDSRSTWDNFEVTLT